MHNTGVNGTLKGTEYAVRLEKGASATFVNVNVDYTGGTRASAISLDKGNFSMTGGEIITAANRGAISFGSGGSIALNNVDIVTGGTGISHGSNVDSTLNITGGMIRHTGTKAIEAGRGMTTIRDGTTVVSSGKGIMVFGTGGIATLDMQDFSIRTSGHSGYGVEVNLGGLARLRNGSITTTGDRAAGIAGFSSSILQSNHVEAQNVTITTSGQKAHGVELLQGTAVLNDVDITIHGSDTYGVLTDGENNAVGVNVDVVMTGGSVTVNGTGSRGAGAVADAQVHLDGVTITLNHALTEGVLSYVRSYAEFKNSTIVGQGTGVRVERQSSALVENSHITSTGANRSGVSVTSQSHADIQKSHVLMTGANSVGLRFLGATAPNSIQVNDSTVQSTQSLAVAAVGGTQTLTVRNNSTISGDELLRVGNLEQGGMTYAGILNLHADNSRLSGHASLSAQAHVSMDLQNGSAWTLRPSAAGLVTSRVSVLNLADALVRFDPMGTGSWQTLEVGAGVPGTAAVYNAGANATIALNTLLNAGGALNNQFTDRVLIQGDVSGVSQLVIVDAPGSPGGWTASGADKRADEGISVVQVAGKASEGSFVLSGGYITPAGLPYRYALHAYGPGASNGLADDAQRLVPDTGTPHWDFRLQSDTAPITVAPQVSTYLLAPTALFEAGRQDVGNLHRRLGDMRNSAPMSADARGEIFMRGYGSDISDYRSGRSMQDHGFDAKIDYKALQLGGNWYRAQNAAGQTRIGLAASLGDLTVTPRHVPDSRKTNLDAWSVSPLLMLWQHPSGGYVDLVTLYGGFKGHVSTDARGQTATLKGKRYAASVEVGKPFDLAGGLALIPQAQLIYQHLTFDHQHDAGDNFPVGIGAQNRWSLRIGGEARQDFGDMTQTGNRRRVYAKLHLLKHFDRNQAVWLGDTLYRGKSGSAAQFGLGVDATFGRGQSAVYGEVNRQQRIGSHGSTGWTFNLGVKTRF